MIKAATAGDLSLATVGKMGTTSEGDKARQMAAHLTARHRELEKRLAALDRYLALSAEEQLERTRLKKEKIWIKDRLLRLEVSAPASSERTQAEPG